MEIKPFLPVVKKKTNLQDKWTTQTLKIVKKNLQNSLYVIAIYLHWICK